VTSVSADRWLRISDHVIGMYRHEIRPVLEIERALEMKEASSWLIEALLENLKREPFFQLHSCCTDDGSDRARCSPLLPDYLAEGIDSPCGLKATANPGDNFSCPLLLNANISTASASGPRFLFGLFPA